MLAAENARFLFTKRSACREVKFAIHFDARFVIVFLDVGRAPLQAGLVSGIARMTTETRVHFIVIGKNENGR